MRSWWRTRGCSTRWRTSRSNSRRWPSRTGRPLPASRCAAAVISKLVVLQSCCTAVVRQQHVHAGRVAGSEQEWRQEPLRGAVKALDRAQSSSSGILRSAQLSHVRRPAGKGRLHSFQHDADISPGRLSLLQSRWGADDLDIGLDDLQRQMTQLDPMVRCCRRPTANSTSCLTLPQRLTNHPLSVSCLTDRTAGLSPAATRVPDRCRCLPHVEFCRLLTCCCLSAADA